MLAAVPVIGDDRDGVAVLQRAGRARRRRRRSRRWRRRVQGLRMSAEERPPSPAMPVSALTPTSADAEEDAAGGGEHDAVVLVLAADVLAHDEQRADREEARLEGDHRREARDSSACPRAVREGDDEEDEAAGGEREAPPLTGPDLEAEELLGHDGEEHETAGEDRLHHRERREGDRGHVQHPGTGADAHADREPGLTPQRGGRAQRATDVDRRRGAGTAVLVEEREVRGERACERQQDAEVEGQEIRP